jgi:hypothetical protein
MRNDLLRNVLGVALVAIAASAAVGCGFKPSAAPPTTGTGGTTTIDGGLGTGGGTGGSMRTGASSLTITPTTATMTVTNSAPAQTQQYSVSGQVNGQTVDLTTEVLYAVSPSGVVTIDKNGLATSTGTRGGVVTVTASSGAVSATATLTVYYTFTGTDPGMTGSITNDPSSIFSTTDNDTARSPSLVYPNDGVLFPPNITGIEIHFTPGANNTLFEVSLSGQYATVNAFVRCVAMGTSGCIYQPDPGLWTAISSANAGQGAVSLVVRGTDDTGTSVGDSAPFHMQFSKDNIDGALYYWTTSGKSAVMRWDFSGSTQSAQAYLTPANTGVTSCIGCHALAPDGSKMVVSANGQGDGRLLLWDIANNKALQPYPLTQRSQFESWNSDGTQFVGVYGDKQSTTNYNQAGPVNLNLFDGMTGMVTSTIALGGLRGDHPDWSKSTDAPNTIVFTSADPTAATSDQRPATGGIDYVQYDGAAWGAPQTLVPSVLGKNRYYPAIAPDGDLVVYDESTCTTVPAAAGLAPDKSCDADTDATATMFLTSISSGGSAPIPLTNANSPGVADGTTTALTNSFPKWAPFVEQLTEQQQLVWLTFSSTRQYGLRAPPASSASSDETKIGTLVWMVGIIPSVGGGDPSYTAFCLPFQDITTSNHIAQWAKYFLTGPG